LLLILTITLFIFILLKENKKTIKIEPIKIESSHTSQTSNSSELPPKKPIEILSKLQVATKVATEGIVPSQEEVSKRILNSLKKNIDKQKIEKPIIVKSIVKKRVIHKRVAKKRVSAKKVKISTQKKVTNHKKITKNKNLVQHSNITKRQPISKTIESSKVTKDRVRHTNLTREEEVALYQQKYSSDLEVVKVSKPFVIEEKKSVPDSYYFEPQKPIETTANTNPTKFVKTLGVVAVSNAYETPLVVPKKVELAKEGIVEFPNAKVETEELKKLKFVEPLEIVEVSKPFETIEADKYLK